MLTDTRVIPVYHHATGAEKSPADFQGVTFEPYVDAALDLAVAEAFATAADVVVAAAAAADATTKANAAASAAETFATAADAAVAAAAAADATTKANAALLAATQGPTLGGIVTWQGVKLRVVSSGWEIVTTDATPGTLASFGVNDETLVAFDVIVTAARRANVTKGGRYKRSVVYRRTGGGVATIVGALESGTDQETDAGLDVTIDTDGANTVRVRVTGLAATNINWTCELRVQETLAT